MRTIDMQSWPRREHFTHFAHFDHPHFGLCANVDLTNFRPFVKANGLSFTVALVYVLARAANEIAEFRYRIHDGVVVEHEVVHPSYTVLATNDVFSFCTVDYQEDFAAFAPAALSLMDRVRQRPSLEDPPGQDNLLFMTAIPWVSFTAALHPVHLRPPDSVPRISWGKFFPEGQLLKMPLGVQVHHALMDGLHVGRYYQRVQDYLSNPEAILGQP